VLYTLAVSSQSEQAETASFERSFDQEKVRIGRQDVNEVQLRDARRLVSGRHAEICQVNGQAFLVDVGSKNGTLLNDRAVISGQEYPLHANDRITIGDFVLCFRPGEALGGPVPAVERAATGALDQTEETLDELLAKLHVLYWEHAGRGPEERKALFVQALRSSLSGLDPASVSAVLARVAARFPDPGYQQEWIALTAGSGEVSASSDEFFAARAAYRRLVEWAVRYLDLGEVKPGTSLDPLLDRLEKAFAVMVDGLADAVKGRSSFEREFDAESTRIFSWKPNPIKLADSGRDIGAYLLDWRRAESADRAASDLEEVFTDLALHQMGLMAGFKESLRGLLAELDPVSLETEARNASFGVGSVRPFGAAAAWQRFKDLHRELTEEEVKTFETILGPHFIRGYLSVQKKKTVS